MWCAMVVVISHHMVDRVCYDRTLNITRVEETIYAADDDDTELKSVRNINAYTASVSQKQERFTKSQGDLEVF